ncbi:hypothetical protein CA85_01640 [Allorhodopirellula solitaria]|uniref:Uncharacterized protein n=1 Tax=Allorhodopirellula solitaria TaxID=2527987 RepID=A0A5C5YJ24_9BACT|nr:hypothetical protein CA85_01640 [Allorhodopirellula solitaria]
MHPVMTLPLIGDSLDLLGWERQERRRHSIDQPDSISRNKETVALLVHRRRVDSEDNWGASS